MQYGDLVKTTSPQFISKYTNTFGIVVAENRQETQVKILYIHDRFNKISWAWFNKSDLKVINPTTKAS